jgi:8-amino-7-oxononanoate synthase
MIDYLVNRARNFIYSTAPSPLMAAAVREALGIVVDEPDRRETLDKLVTHAAEQLGARLALAASGSQILPVIIGDNGRTLRVAERMQASGFDIRAIRPPTVPEGTARLRIAITLNVDEAQIATMFERLAMVIAEEMP